MSSNKAQEKDQDKEPFLVCLDPETGQIYSLGLLSQHVHLEKDVPIKIRERAKTALRRLTFLKEGSGMKWWFKSEAAQLYRRRRLPIYLIQGDCARYPTYEAHSNLSLIFSNVQSLEFRVNISEYAEVITSQLEESSKVLLDEIKLDVALVNGADEVIKNIMRLIYKEYQLKLKPISEKSKFVLKVSGFKEYFMGSVPILAYETIRASLRGAKFINVILTEISSTVSCETFPPLVERLKKDTKNGYYEPIDWKKYEETPFFIWYPPRELPQQKLAKDLLFEKNKWASIKYDSIPSMKPLLTTPVFNFRQKEFMLETQIREFKRDCVYTGEMDTPYKVRICGIDNLDIIFSQFDQGATDNGFCIPSYITKSPARKNDGHGVHGASGKKKKALKEKDPLIIPKIGKTTSDDDAMDLYHCDQGANNQLFTKLVKNGEFEISPFMVTVEMSLYYGSKLLQKGACLETKPVPFSFGVRWNEWLCFPEILTSQLPKEARICFNVKVYAPTGEQFIIASVSHTVFDFYGRMKDGLVHLNLWPFYEIDSKFVSAGEFWFLREKVLFPKPEEIDRFKTKQYARLVLQFDIFNLPVFWSLRDPKKMPPLHTKENLLKKTPTTHELSLLRTVLVRDPLNWNFNEAERELLLKCRHHYKNTSSYLPLFLSAIDWSDPEEVAEAHFMLKVWEPMAPEEALMLLDSTFPDAEVRFYAVQRISEFSDDDLALYLLELVQALVYENQHWSPLGEFLLERSLGNPQMVGHEFFWLLKSQLHVKPSFERFGLLLEQFLMLCGSFAKELEDELTANLLITEIAEEIPKLEKSIMLPRAREKLANLKKRGLPDDFAISVDTRMRGCDFAVEQCRVADSKKHPLLLSIKNVQPDAKNIRILFKTGDDLRQDLLTLQLIKIMDKIWLDNGLDLRMKPYRVQSTADQVGMIELVPDSENVSDIHQIYGFGALGALAKTTIQNFLEKFNPTEESMNKAKENFIRSTAGYSVATYLLGIADRHTGNIMVTKDGHLFHIDFGHFLGNFKTKFGIRRERTPFVFLEEMAYVMGGRKTQDFNKFSNFCTQAFNLVRKKGNLFISLFIMMLSAGMPELQEYADIEYLKNRLSLELSEQEANILFINEIHKSLDEPFRKIDNFFHALMRKTEKGGKKDKSKKDPQKEDPATPAVAGEEKSP